MNAARLFFLFGLTLACQSAPHATTQPSTSGGQLLATSTQPPPSPPPNAAKPQEKPQTKQACSACGGRWEVFGLAQAESCICRTKDAGHPCRDGAECEGACLAPEDAKFEVVSAGPPPRGFFVGHCSEYDTVFGCYRVVEHGARARGPAPAEEAAHRICVD